MPPTLLILAACGHVGPAAPEHASADRRPVVRLARVLRITAHRIEPGPPEIPPGGNAWATVVRNRQGRRVDVLDLVKKPGNLGARKVPGRSYIYLNRGIPEVLPLPAEALAGLTERDAERTALAEEYARRRGPRLAGPVGPWTVVIVAAERLDRAAADRRNAGAPPADGPPVWEPGDYRVQAVPSAGLEVIDVRSHASLGRDVSPRRTEHAGPGVAAWLGGRPEVWRYRAGAWALVDAGEMYAESYAGS